MPPVPPIPAELWDQIPPAPQAAILALVQQWSIFHSGGITNMANSFGIPEEVECRLRQKFKVCAYCRHEMQEYAGVLGCSQYEATIEHLNRNGPFDWSEGLREEELVICCRGCNSSRKRQRLADWFLSQY